MKIKFFFGSDREFDALLINDNINRNEALDFMTIIKEYNEIVRASNMGFLNREESYLEVDKPLYDYCIIKKDDYGIALEQVINNFSTYIEASNEIETLYIQNAPKRVVDSLISAYPDEYDFIYQEYKTLDQEDLKPLYEYLDEKIVGQQTAKIDTLTGAYKSLKLQDDNKPLILLLYGPSGVGKTQLAKSLSDYLEGELTRIQFSMYQNMKAIDYVYGSDHNKDSFAKDILARESNVILLDEFDKVNSNIYNAFYEAFDEGHFIDSNYSVNLSDIIFILTTNFDNESDIISSLGYSLYSRIDSVISFDYLSNDDKKIIINNIVDSVLDDLNEEEKMIVPEEDIRSFFMENIESFDNTRIINSKIKNAFSKELIRNIIQ